MGLDIYLYKYDDYAATKSAEELAEEESKMLWESVGGYDKATEEQKADVRVKTDEMQKLLGFNGYHPPGEEKIEMDSLKYPEHMFKVGYFRSSYNDGGIESLLGNLLGYHPLHRIFDVEDGEYEFQPNWAFSFAKVEAVICDFDEATKDGFFAVIHEGQNMFASEPNATDSSEKAMQVFQSERNRRNLDPDFSSYSNRDGSYYFSKEALMVRGLISGTRWGKPCVYAVYERDADSKAWYRQSLEIVRETIQWVLAQPDKEKFWLHWSG